MTRALRKCRITTPGSVECKDKARTAQFLSVFLPFREGNDETLPEIKRLEGQGAVGVRLAWPDGAEDLISFRTDPEARLVGAGGMESDGSVFARGTDSQGRTVRSLTQPLK